MRSHKMSRRALTGLFAVAVTAVAATTTGLALADESNPSVESLPSVRIEYCEDGEWGEVRVRGVNQNGETILQDFKGEGCAVLAGEDGTEYWWAFGEGRILSINRNNYVEHFPFDGPVRGNAGAGPPVFEGEFRDGRTVAMARDDRTVVMDERRGTP
jgi:hypothetical protein